MKIAAFLCSSFLLLGASSGCSSEPKAKSPADQPAVDAKAAALAGTPDWVTGDCRKQFPGQQVVCGVGAVSGVSSPSLARNAAMGRGRTEIARFLKVEVTSVLRDYQATSNGKVEQNIEDQSEQITAMTLSGTKMSNYFIGKDGTYYALMVLGFEDFQSSLEGAQTIEAPMRSALLKGCKKAFSSRDDETRQY
jgi:hypothetical protein